MMIGTMRVNLVLDLAAGGALLHFARSLKECAPEARLEIVDVADPSPPEADVWHYITWYLYRDAVCRGPAERSLVTIHHLMGMRGGLKETVHELCSRRVPLVTMSGEWYSYMRRVGADPASLSLIPHGVDLDYWSPASDGGAPEGPPVIGIVGQVYPNGRKGERLVPRICNALRGVPFRVVIVGRFWENVVARLKEDGHDVTYFPTTSLDQLRELVRQFTIFLCTSDVEGGPLTLLEALAAGSTPVSTPVGLSRDLIPGGGLGYLFPKGNAQSAARAIRRVLAGNAPRVDQGFARQVLEVLSWKRAAASYEAVYRSVFEGKPIPTNPSGYREVLSNRMPSNVGERLALWANPNPTSSWSQPVLWRAFNRLFRRINAGS